MTPTDLAEMCPFPHRGTEYYADESERIFNSEGKLLGYICSRGPQYAWGACHEDDTEFARGNGTWVAGDVPEEDPAMDAILAAHAKIDSMKAFVKDHSGHNTEPSMDTESKALFLICHDCDETHLMDES